MNKNYKRLKIACYTASLSMSIVANLPPVLLLTFRSLYGVSFSMLGALVLINFLTQLAVDLLFSFFSHKFNIAKSIKLTPYLTALGLMVYALWPLFFPQTAIIGLILGTLIFSSAAGLVEVLNSPVLAMIPAKDPDREMSKLHSVYAWGVVIMVGISSLFIVCFGLNHWQWLVFILMLVPILSAFLFAGTDIPVMETPEKISGAIHFFNNKSLWFFIAAIFLGGAAECTMGQWASGYLEKAMNVPKIWGDLFGMALFSLMLGLGRFLYGKIGKNIGRVLFLSTVSASLCYLITAITSLPIMGLLACALTGFATSMLWPGSLIAVKDRFPAGGVLMYAIMAAGGDLGASVGPQLVGVITDLAIHNPLLLSLAQTLNLLPEQFGMKLGLLTAMLFPLCSIPLFGHIWYNQNRRSLTKKIDK